MRLKERAVIPTWDCLTASVLITEKSKFLLLRPWGEGIQRYAKTNTSPTCRQCYLRITTYLLYFHMLWKASSFRVNTTIQKQTV
jgi:hypothetical protein